MPARYMVATVAFLNTMYLYILRLNVNIAIVAMVNYTAIPHTNIRLAEECHLELLQDDELDLQDDTEQFVTLTVYPIILIIPLIISILQRCYCYYDF